eukprot:CAMPEP_0174713724 /NCGR_PEP_ID=MMETSP1094-20130205/14297_1 /TAXON_ID=156173 /ORGANISM="Chrysochromulina brevifilum, Strain UTEX LB 985" /LENGTH=92 /DNA_ID=CAMNT_0015912925 /DNA_START=536 /DNA_END=812 /DNA_ORIENTATION=-
MSGSEVEHWDTMLALHMKGVGGGGAALEAAMGAAAVVATVAEALVMVVSADGETSVLEPWEGDTAVGPAAVADRGGSSKPCMSSMSKSHAPS